MSWTEAPAEAKKAISIRLRAWAKENPEKQARLDQLGQTMTHLLEQIAKKEAELKAVREEYSRIMVEKREFLQAG